MALATSPPAAKNRVEVDGDGNADRDAPQEAWRGSAQDRIELVDFLLSLILHTRRLARQLRGDARVKESIDDKFRVFQPLVGRKSRNHLIQYGFDRADPFVAPAKYRRPLPIVQCDALIEVLTDHVDFR